MIMQSFFLQTAIPSSVAHGLIGLTMYAGDPSNYKPDKSISWKPLIRWRGSRKRTIPSSSTTTTPNAAASSISSALGRTGSCSNALLFKQGVTPDGEKIMKHMAADVDGMTTKELRDLLIKGYVTDA